MSGSGDQPRGCAEGLTHPSPEEAAVPLATECLGVRARALAAVRLNFLSPTPSDAVATVIEQGQS
jgi:hypothetical protein